MLESKCDALVCPVNCEGVMGAGVAKLFRDNFDNTIYKNACLAGELAPGSVVVRPVHAMAKDTQKTLVYVATKNDWRNDSKIEWVETGLLNLVRAMYYYNIKSVALPAIGAGKGNLPWPSVELIIKTIFENDGLTKLVEVYLPHEA
jgi:O-acetyl-ADP-ribose deacetylase (regulator of RNase III)